MSPPETTSAGPTSRGNKPGDLLQPKILSAAATVFARGGLDATVAEVATEAGVGVATVYRRFANKDELIMAIYAPTLDRAATAAQAAAANPDPWDGFVTYFRDNLRQLVADRGFRELALGVYAGNVGWSRSTPPDRILEQATRTERIMAPHHVELVRRAQDSGDLRTDFEPSDMLVLITAVVSTADFAGSTFPELPQRVATVVLDGLRPARSSPTAMHGPAVTDDDLARARAGASSPDERGHQAAGRRSGGEPTRAYQA